MDLEAIFNVRNCFPPIENSFWMRIKRIWTENRVYNSSYYYSAVSFNMKVRWYTKFGEMIIYLYEFQVDGKIQLHSLSPEIRSIFDQIWHHHFWNIENSSILLSLKSGFVLNLKRVTNQWSFFYRILYSEYT